MGASQVTKGKSWERQVARILEAAMPGCASRRDFQQQTDHGRADVTHPFLWVECKAQKRCNPRAALAQALETCPDHKHPIAICKDDRQPPYVMMRADDFLELMEALWVEQCEQGDWRLGELQGPASGAA